MQGRLGLLSLPLLVLAAVLAGFPAATPAQAASPEFRAFWVDAYHPGIYNPGQIDKLVADAKAANMNAIIVQVGRRGDCFCNKAIMPRTEAAIDPLPFDPLQTLIDKAHAQGIEVHAWISTTAIWSSTTPPVAPNHVFNTHGPSKTGYDNWIMLRSDGLNRSGSDFYLDPGHPDAAAYIVSMATSIVANYDVDGINLDRIRYPDGTLGVNIPSWGYNPAAVARFQAATGRGDVPDATDPQWMQWRRDQITDIVRRVYLESYALKPNVRVSADTIPYGYGPQSQGGWTSTHTFLQVLQDWRGWLQEGILDLNIPMNYKNEDLTTAPDNNQRLMLEEWNEFIKDNQYGRQSAIGAGISMNSVEDTITQVRKAEAPSAAGNRAVGWVGYSYGTPDRLALQGTRSADASRAELRRALTQPSEYDPVTPPVFASPATVPEMTWKTQPTTGHLKGTLKAGDGTPLDRVWVELHDAATKAFLAARSTDASGWFGFVDLKPGRYDVTLGGARAGARPVAVADVAAGKLTTVDLSFCPGIVPDGLFCVEYFDNPTLSAPAVYATTEPTIDHDWAAGSPAPRVGADNFSARWQGTFSFDAANYTFVATADDGVRVWIDDDPVPLIDQWRDQAPARYQATVRLSAGYHKVTMEYYEHGGGAVATLGWSQDCPEGQYRMEYLSYRSLSGTPALFRCVPVLLVNDWGSGRPAPGVGSDGFSARWVGNLAFQSDSIKFMASAAVPLPLKHNVRQAAYLALYPVERCKIQAMSDLARLLRLGPPITRPV